MIHTVELRSKSSDFASFLRFQNNPDLCHHYPGITIEPSREGKGKGKWQYKLKAKINLIRTIEPTNYLGTYAGQNAALILDTINQAFADMELPGVQAWTLSRVDFTIDIRTQYLSAYLTILEHGRHKYQPVFTEHGLYIPYSDRGITVNFYDKEAEQLGRGYPAEDARNILRLEVQCHDKKLATMFSKQKVNRDLASLLLAFDGSHLIAMLNETIGKELPYIVGDFDHITRAATVSKIQESKGMKRGSITQLVNIVNRINRKGGSFSKTQNAWPKAAGVSQDVFKERIKALARLKINPICVPPGCPTDRLENLTQLYLDALAQEWIAAE